MQHLCIAFRVRTALHRHPRFTRAPDTHAARIPHLPLQLHIREHVLQCSVQRLHGRGGKTAHHICVDNVLHVRAEPLRLYSAPTYTLSVAHCLVFL